MLAYTKKIAGVLASVILTPMAMAASLQDVKFAELPGDKVEIRLVFDEAPSKPKGYTIEQPARIVLDFEDVDNALDQKKFSMDMGGVSSAVILASGTRTRMIVNMNDLAPYETRLDGNQLIVEIGDTGGVAVSAVDRESAAVAVSTAADSGSSSRFDRAKSGITDIDFRRGDAGEGKVIVSLSNPGISIDVEEVAGGIEIGFLRTDIPSKLVRKLDVSDFATPVQLVSVLPKKLRTVLKIDASGEYDYLAYQADNEYVVSIKPLTKAEIAEQAKKFAYTGEKLSLNFQNIEVRSVLQVIADFTDLNLVASDTVKGSITLRLDSVPWDQALELVLKTKGLDKRQIGNVLMVAPAAEIAERERQEIATQKQLQELAPLKTEYIRIRYANARELFELFLSEQQQSSGGSAGGPQGRNSTGTILSDRGHAIVDDRTNSIILTDTEEKINEFRTIIDQIDIPIRQVMIEARIVVANNDFRKELGTRISGAQLSTNNNGDSNLITGGLDGLFDSGGNHTAGFFRDRDRDGTSDAEIDVIGGNNFTNLSIADPAGSFTWNLIGSDIFLGLELSALEQDGYAEIVSQPKVITGDKQQASIENGQEIGFQEASASGATTTQFKEAVLKLDVTPQITPDDNIIMDLSINQDSIGGFINGQFGSQIPQIDVTQLETQVLVGDGQTVVLGGIFQTETTNTTTKVPLLGDVPILGKLFRRNVKRDDKREVIIFITPRILSNTLTN